MEFSLVIWKDVGGFISRLNFGFPVQFDEVLSSQFHEVLSSQIDVFFAKDAEEHITGMNIELTSTLYSYSKISLSIAKLSLWLSKRRFFIPTK